MASFDLKRRNRKFRPEMLGPELLEQREVMAASAMGFSLPDVSVGNYVAPVAAWGQPYTVQVQAFNRGASSLPEPLAQFPYASSMADANTTVSVYLTKGNGPRAARYLLDTLPLSTITQNSVYGTGANAQFTINMPATPPAGFPAAGGQFKLVFVPNVTNQIRLPGTYPNQGSYSVPVKVLPSDLQGLNQRPLVGGLRNLPAGTVNNLSLASNQTTVTGGKVTLPTTGSYYIGYIIDPEYKYTQVSDNAGVTRSPRLLGAQLVAGRHGFATPQNLTDTAAALFPSVPYTAPNSYVVVLPQTEQVPVKVAYPPNAALGGMKTKPRGWV